MNIEYKIIIALAATVIILFLLWRRASEKLAETKFRNHSLSARYGKTTEQFMPFLEHYPFEPGNFRFIGTPIDGIQFEDDKIIFIEFKTADSKFTPKQKNIKELVEKRKVEFVEFRI